MKTERRSPLNKTHSITIKEATGVERTTVIMGEISLRTIMDAWEAIPKAIPSIIPTRSPPVTRRSVKTMNKYEDGVDRITDSSERVAPIPGSKNSLLIIAAEISHKESQNKRVQNATNSFFKLL